MKKLLVLFASILFACADIFAVKLAAPSEADKRKAEYYYIQATVKLVEDDVASFRDLIERAYLLDPQNTAIAYQYGYSFLLTQNQTRRNAVEGLRLMKRFVDKYPSNFYENFLYAHACNQIVETDEAIRIWEGLLREYPDRVALYQLLSEGYAGKGNYDNAIAALDSLEKAEDTSNEITIRKIGYLLAKKDTVAAVDEGKRVIKVTNNSYFGNVLMGEIFMQIEKPDSSMAYFNKAQEIEPNNGYISLSKANVYRAIGDTEGYEREIRAAIVNKEVNVDTKLRILTSYIGKVIEEPDTTEVVYDASVDNSSDPISDLFNKVVEQHPHEAEVRKLYADYQSLMKDYVAAAEQLSYAIDINPADDKCWKRLMWIMVYLGEYDKCIEVGERALSYLPNDGEIFQILATPYYHKKDYLKSNELLETALEIDKEVGAVSISDVYSTMAENYNRLNEREKSFEYYEKALEISPKNFMAMNNYAYGLCVAGVDLDRAERLSKAAVDAEPENDTYLDTYAWVCFKRQEYKKALEYMERTIECTEGELSAVILEHYGDILFMNGEPKKALEQWQEALKLDSSSEILQKKVKNKTYFYE